MRRKKTGGSRFCVEKIACVSALSQQKCITLKMNRKKTFLIAFGWTACTAGAFWAGTCFTGNNGADDRAKSRQGGFAAVQDAAAAEAGTKGNGRATGRAGSEDAAGGSAAGKAIRDLTPKETADRVKAIFAMEDPLERMEAYLAFMKGIKGDEQIAAAMEAMTSENYNNRERGKEFSMLMTRWAKESPEAALAWTQTHDDWRAQWGAGSVLSLYARSNPDAAIAWAQAHPPKNKDEGNWHLASVISGLAKDDLDRASLLAQNMDRSEARGRAMESVLDNFFKQRGPDGARDAVMALQEGPYKNGLVQRLAERLADKDPASAAKWALTLPDNEARPRVMTEVIDEWAEKNPNDAGVWLNGLGGGPGMDEPRERFAWKVQEKDPEAAIAWANTITDERRRNETSFRLVREWMQREPDNARAWVSTSQLPDDMKERLLRDRRRG